MKINRDILIIAAISMALSITGFILDLNERVPDIKTNIFEILIMAGVVFGIISIFYFPVKFIVTKFRKQGSQQAER